VAIAAAVEIAGQPSPEAIAAVAASLPLPGRMEWVATRPPRILDAAHNPAAAAALAEALTEAGEPLVGCLAVLDDKDAAGICAALAPVLAAAVCTEVPAEALVGSGRPGARSLPAAELAELVRASGVAEVEAQADPMAALGRAAELATERAGPVLLTGSHYLLRYARGQPQAGVS
jgi:dihydrofolate synthase/folylpolyglutamate synthase